MSSEGRELEPIESFKSNPRSHGMGRGPCLIYIYIYIYMYMYIYILTRYTYIYIYICIHTIYIYISTFGFRHLRNESFGHGSNFQGTPVGSGNGDVGIIEVGLVLSMITNSSGQSLLVVCTSCFQGGDRFWDSLMCSRASQSTHLVRPELETACFG